MPDTGVFQFIQDLLTQTFGFAPPQLLLRVIAGVLLVGLFVLGIQVLAMALKSLLTEVFQPLFYKPEDRRRRLRRHLFADYIDGEIRFLNSKEAWNDNRFTELEAEVEAEGGRLLLGVLPVGSFRGMGLRREKSLSRALEQSSERLILLEGDPGSGKSVALRHVAQVMASKAKKSGNLKIRMPVYVNLKYLNRPPNEEIGRKLIEDYVLQALNRVNDRDIDDFLHEEFQRGLGEGTWYFLFDSFDEIPEVLSSTGTDATIRQYAEAIRDFLHSMNKCKGIVASREYKGPRFLGWPKFRILPLSNQQRREFVRKTGLQTDIQRIILSGLTYSSVDFRVMASNPMFLNLICEYMGRKKDEQFPKQTYSVYEEYIERRFFLDENRLMTRFQLTPQDLRNAAERLAFCMTADKELGLSPNLGVLSLSLSRLGLELNSDFEKVVRALEYIKIARIESSAIADSKTFTFSHRRFQEFFATKIVLQDPQRISPKTLLFDARWRETAVTILQTKDDVNLTPILDEAFTFLDSLKSQFVSFVKEIVPPKKEAKKEGGSKILLLSDDEIRRNIRFFFRKSLRNYFRKIRIQPRRNEIVFRAPLSWSKDYYHLLSILQDGSSGRHQIIYPRLQELINQSLEFGFLNGSIVDKKWILDVAGAADGNVIEKLFLKAFQAGNEWIQNSAFWLISKIDRISPELIPSVRNALVQMALNRELSIENSDLIIQLSRLSDYKSLPHIVRLLSLLPVVDVIFGVSSVALISFLPLQATSKWVFILLFIYPLFSLWIKWSKTSKLLFSANNYERSSAISIMPFVVFVFGVLIYGAGVFNDIGDITIQNILNSMMALPNRFYNTPISIYLLYVILNAWSGVSIIEALDGRRVHPLWWTLYAFFPIIATIYIFGILLAIIPLIVVGFIRLLINTPSYVMFLIKRFRVIFKPLTYYLILQTVVFQRSVKAYFIKIYQDFQREVLSQLMASPSQIIGSMIGVTFCLAFFVLITYGDALLNSILIFLETSPYVRLGVDFLLTYGLLLLAFMIMFFTYTLRSDAALFLEQLRVATYDQFRNYQRLIDSKTEISVPEILEMVGSLDIKLLRVMLIQKIREQQLLVANSYNESELAVSVAFIDGLLSYLSKPGLDNYLQTFASNKGNISDQLEKQLLKQVSDIRESNSPYFTKWDHKQFNELCKLFDQIRTK